MSVILDSRDMEPGMDYSESVINLVSAAVGVAPEYIAVETLPFNGLEEAASTWDSYNELKQQMQRWQMIRFFIILGVVLLVVVVLIIMIARRGKKSPEREVEQLFPSLSPEASDSERGRYTMMKPATCRRRRSIANATSSNSTLTTILIWLRISAQLVNSDN